MKKRYWILKERAGQEIVDGKSHYPDGVTIVVSKNTAIDMANQLLSKLRLDDQDIEITFYVPGRLEEDTES